MNFYIGGRLAAAVKEAICKGTLWGLRREARKPGSISWLQGRQASRAAGVAPQVVTES